MPRVVLFHGPGEPLEQVEVPAPEPRGQELLVRIDFCTLCRSDLHTHAGRRPGPTPVVLGHEIVGRIEAFGPSCPRVDARGHAVSPGDRVTWTLTASCGKCFYCGDGLPQKCTHLYKYGHERATPEQPFGGGLADLIVLRAGTAWLHVPDEISDRLAAPASCATATVAAVLRHAGPIQDRHILVLGAGMLGLTACAMARAAGARAVLVSDPQPACLKRAASFGATHLLPARDAELADAVAAGTAGRGADVVLELAGVQQTVQAGLNLVRIGGTLVLAGTVSRTAPVALDPEDVVRRLLTIRGVHNYQPRDLETALEFLVGPGRAFPFESLVGTTFPLERAEEAFAEAHAHPGVRIAVGRTR